MREKTLAIWMARRLAALALPVVVVLLVIGQPALAKCCRLDHIVVKGPGLEDGITLTHSQLEATLSDGEFVLLYWPLFNGSSKGDHRPSGNLGPAYEITYILPNSDGEPVVTAVETVYPFVDPPVAFAQKGQRQDLYAGDGGDSPIPWGWRPFPAAAVGAIFSEHKDSLPPGAKSALARVPIEIEKDPAFPLGLLLLGLSAAVVAALWLGWPTPVKQ